MSADFSKLSRTDEKPLVEDLADVLSRMVVGWEPELGVDLAEHPDVVRVMARYRREVQGTTS